MSLVRRTVRGRGFCLFFLAVVLAWPPPVSSQAADVYSPKLPAGITTIEAAREDLARLLEKRSETMRIFYDGIPAPLVGSPGIRTKFFQSYPQTKELLVNDTFFTIDTYGVKVLHDRIDLPVRPLYYEDLPGFNITVQNGAVAVSPQIELRFGRAAMAEAQRVADDLFFIQQNIVTLQKENEAAFQEKAAQYRTLKTKPAMSEEQRRLVVQAESLNDRKEYAKAIDAFQKAIDVDPVSYPPAYFDLALLSAQMQRFKPALVYMKKYLLLVPDAKDARAAQDKIYDWELK